MHKEQKTILTPPSICSNAQNQVDSMLFQYLIENNLVDGNAVDGEGNGLVYTAFVAANVSALNILAKVSLFTSWIAGLPFI